MKFPYVAFGGKFLPIVPVRLGREKWISVDAYVDSGASYSVFHAWITEAMGLRLEDGEKDYLTVGDGSHIMVYMHPMKVQLAGKEFDANIGFSRRLGVGFNILGRADIFDRFTICFSDKQRVVEFKEVS